MSLFQSSADEVRVLSGGADVFSVLYARAQVAYPRGIWVEGFGTVKGASIIELTGDKHRESVREATLGQFSATVVSDGESHDIRSVATLTWREKRNQRTLTGFLASAYATHVTLRIREVDILHGDAAQRVDASVSAPVDSTPAKSVPSTVESSEPVPIRTARVESEPAKSAPIQTARGSGVSRSERAAPERTPVQRDAAERDAIQSSASSARASQASTSVNWDDLDTMFDTGTKSAPHKPEAAPQRPKAKVKEEPKEQATIGWGDVAAASAEPVKPQPSKTTVGAPVVQPAQQSLIDDMDGGGGGWDQVAAVSDEVEKKTTTAAQTLKKGEVLVHPNLGNCTIISVLSETVVMVKPRRARARKISLKPFVVTETDKRGFYALTRG